VLPLQDSHLADFFRPNRFIFLWYLYKYNYLKTVPILGLLALSLFSWQCGQHLDAKSVTISDSSNIKCAPSCGTPHSRAGALMNQAGSQLLSNGAKVPAMVDTSKWPPKPWPSKMVWIPSITYSMGGVGKEARKDEFPVHKVSVEGFWMDQTEVTVESFKQFTDATHYLTTAEQKPDWEELKKQLPPGTPKPSDEVLAPGSLIFAQTNGPVALDDFSQWWKWEVGANWRNPDKAGENILNKPEFKTHPVVQVSWYDAEAYAKWAGKKLPTEAEWECAAREGVEGEIYGWGNDAPDDKNIKANIWQGKFPYNNSKEDGYVLTSPVGSYAPNKYGLYDMMGNVWEWCEDWYRPDTYTAEAKNGISKDPKGPANSFDPEEPLVAKRVVRGGSFLCNATYCASYRPAARMKTSPDTGENHTGFRCAMTDKQWRIKLQQSGNKG
jgi:formylglycine-generating enzyme required for sulfatase activity